MPVPRSLVTAAPGDLDLELTSGTWPDDLAGEVVISGPEPNPAFPYQLFGFGTMYRLSLRPGSFGAADDRWAWRHRVLDTPSRRLYERRPEQFNASVIGVQSSFGFPNMANTAPLPWGDRLFATWDVGRPVEVDPMSLGFLGEIGSCASWGEQTMPMGEVLPFYFGSAHPVVDPDRGCLWTVKLMMGPTFEMSPHVVRYSGDGTEVDTWPVTGASMPGSSHTISQTRDWLILCDSGNFKADPAELMGAPRTVTIDTQVPLYLLRKDAITSTPAGHPLQPQTFTIAPPTGHFYAVYDDTDGIRILFEHMDLMDLGIGLRPDDTDAFGRPIDPVLAGLYNTAMAPSSLTEVTLEPGSGRATTVARLRDEWTWNLQLSAMDWSTEGLSCPTLHHIAYQGYKPETVGRRALDLYADRLGPLPGDETPGVLTSIERGSLDVRARWEYPDTADLISSPTFAPRSPTSAPATRSRYAGDRPGGHDGYVIVPVCNDNGFRVEVFDASAVGAGPVATLSAPAGACVPLLLHSAWMPRVAPAPDAHRLCWGEDVSRAAGGLDDELAVVVHEVIEDLNG